MEFDNRRTFRALSNFDIYTTPYKTISDHAITVDVLIPKNIQPGKPPLAVRIHGGGLVTGSSSFAGFLAPWIVEYAFSKSAVLLMPNYRLLPEASGIDILADLEDFWAWVSGGELKTFVDSKLGSGKIEVDTNRIWVHGESAGGYLAIQSGLLLPPQTIRVISSAFPMLDFDDPWYNIPHPLTDPKTIPATGTTAFFGAPIVPISELTSHLSSSGQGKYVSAADPPDRFALMLALGQHGKWMEFMGKEEKLYPMRAVRKRGEEGKGGREIMPPLFIYHGRDDKGVPVEGTERFVEAMKKAGVGEDRLVWKIENGDHGFDKDSNLDDSLLKDGVALVEREWLS